MDTLMKALICAHLIFGCLAQSDVNAKNKEACKMLQSAHINTTIMTSELLFGPQCEKIQVQQGEAISGGYCLASLAGAGYFRASSINPISAILQSLEISLGFAPIITGSNSGGTMFIVRYYAFQDIPTSNKWTFPCYLLQAMYRGVCFFHGNFGLISEECYSENQNLIGLATNMIYGQLITNNGGPLGIVSSYCSVYFSFLSNLPLQHSSSLTTFWKYKAHWSIRLHAFADWNIAFTFVNGVEASSGTQSYNYGFDSYLSRGMDALTNDWYSNMSVYSVASISANTLSGISLLPFSFAGKEWDNSGDSGGVTTIFKVAGLVISFLMAKKLMNQHTVLMTSAAPQCQTGCPLLDGGFTDNGPITPILAAASKMNEALRPRQVGIQGPSNTMQSIQYLLGTGPLSIWTFGGLNLCPFTQVSICRMMTIMRGLIIPQMKSETAQKYNSIGSHYQVFRPNQQVLKPHCPDPLIFDDFNVMCQGDSICHMAVVAVPGRSTAIGFSISLHMFSMSMIWLAPSKIASRFVTQYIPDEMRVMDYYADMTIWFPDFVAIAPQKGGVGFTKIAGHSLLDYLTYLVIRLTKTLAMVRIGAHMISLGQEPLCGYGIFQAAQAFTGVKQED